MSAALDSERSPVRRFGIAVLCAKVALVPLVFHQAFDVPFTVPKALLSHALAYVLAGVLLAFVIRYRGDFVRSWLYAPVLAFLLANGLATAFAVDPYLAFYGTHVLYLAASQLIRTRRDLALPSGIESEIAAIETYDGPVSVAFPPMSVTVRLATDIDVSRGDVLARPLNRPHVGAEIDAMVCSVEDAPIAAGRSFALLQGPSATKAIVDRVRYRLDIDTLHRDTQAEELRINDIGRVRLRAAKPLVYDEYRRNRATGCFVLVDEQDNRTVAAGMIIGAAAD